MADTTCIIIGAGLMGVTAAHALQARGFDVTLIDKASGPAMDTSFANAGMLHPSMPAPWNGPGIGKHLAMSLFNPHAAMKLRLSAIPGLAGWGAKFLQYSSPKRHLAAAKANYFLSAYSILRTQAQRDALGLNFDSVDNGTLKIFGTQASFDTARHIGDSLAKFGLTHKPITAAEAIAHEPALADIKHRIIGATYQPDDSIGDAYKFTCALYDDFEHKGGHSRFECTVQNLIVKDGSCIGVETDQGKMFADHIVVAAGSFSRVIAKSAGVKLDIQPAKGYSITVDTNGSAALPKIAVIDEAMHCAITPLGDTLRVAGTAEFTGFNTALTSARVKNLKLILGQTYPGIMPDLDLDNAKPWTGFRPMPADGVPYIGEANVSGLWINAGHGHLGWTMASGSAELLASLMTYEPPPIDPEPYRVNR